MSHPISLSPSEAACLEALRSGSERKMLIAQQTKLTLPQTAQALRTLESLGLATTLGGRRWHVAGPGKTADIAIAPPAPTRGRKSMISVLPGTSAARLLKLVEKPRRGTELAALLNVTRQRIHQLVVGLSARGLIRTADPEFPTFVVALRDDRSILLRQDQERVLSAFPTEPTTLSKIALAVNMRASKTAALAATLRDAQLIEKVHSSTQGDLYQLTAAGSAHWQRSATARHAVVPPPPFRSDRVRDVLSYLATHGPTRTCDIGRALDISQHSINALMQYFKRKGAACRLTDGRHGLTADGHAILAAMTRHAMSSTAATGGTLPTFRRSAEQSAHGA